MSDGSRLRCFGVLRAKVSEFTGLLSNQGEKLYKLVFHNGSFKKEGI